EEDSHGPWDAYNLTEDFDLGMRMYKKDFQYKIAIIDSITKEESPTTWKGWLKQRTRWHQGKIQTLKKMIKEFIKNPKDAIKNFPKTYTILMECTTPHLGPINLTGINLSGYAYMNDIDFGLGEYLMLYNLGSIAYYSALQGIGYYLAAKEENKSKKELIKNSLKVALTTPLYWVPLWLADLRAVKREHITKANDWEKTSHYGKHINDENYKNKNESIFSKLKSKILEIKDKIKNKSSSLKEIEQHNTNYNELKDVESYISEYLKHTESNEKEKAEKIFSEYGIEKRK
ncbi:MAG TPA: hypothetical protein EYH56_01130, partial [Nanoarchaeota archaeon]|nr:hypothetical protein [Nanoarchaeota archaeon]